MIEKMLEKKCCGCEIIKNVKEFYISRSSKDGYQNKCKGCDKKYKEENKDKIKEREREYYENNKKKILEREREYYENNKKKINERGREYYENNKKKILEKKKEYYENNKKKIKEYRENNKEREREYYENNKDRLRIVRREYNRNRISNDPLFKLKKGIRWSIHSSLKNGGYTKNSKTNDILGCSYEELLDHLNDNKYGFIYGDDNLDIDHIIPLSRATSEEEIIELNHYSNLQLLPSDYNRYIKRDNDFDNECLEEWLIKTKMEKSHNIT